MFHKHNWVKIKETYAQSLREQGFTKIDKMDACWAAQCLMQDVTTILWECSICKKTRKEEMLGKGE